LLDKTLPITHYSLILIHKGTIPSNPTGGIPMPFAQSNDISIHYTVRGESGAPLIMISGYGGDITGWPSEFVDRLAAKHRVILFDNRGVGYSDKPDIPYSMAMFAADTISVLDALGIERAHVMGASMGGIIAQHVALTYPERLLSLMLSCTAAAAGVESPHVLMPDPVALAHLQKPPSGDRAQDLREGWPQSYTEQFIAANKSSLERDLQVALNYPESPFYARQRQLSAIFETHDMYERLPEIRCPVLVQVGTDDRLLPPENSRIIASQIPQARLIEYEECGHGFMREAVEQVVADMFSFMQEAEATQR
jgi:pimeloyl-ACP methyl ester carboxylesterase